MVRREAYIEYYRSMLRIRYFEEKIDWMFSRGMLGGTAHLCIGQEAAAVGAMVALEKGDYAISNHRGHGHLLAKGAEPGRLMAEMMGKGSGYCRGKGGSQHLCVKEISFMGTNGITGGGIPVATGLGLSLRLQGRPEVVICFFGDGASNQGTFHESLNMASLWKVPVIYFCENNLYAMSTSIEESLSVKDVAIRSVSYNMQSKIVNGMDLLSVRDAVSEAAERARSGGGPTLIEAKTYRFCGHSKSDARKYRTREEEEIWRRSDPISKWESFMLEKGIERSIIPAIQEEVKRDIESAVEFAMKSDYAPAEEAFVGEYCE